MVPSHRTRLLEFSLLRFEDRAGLSAHSRTEIGVSDGCVQRKSAQAGRPQSLAVSAIAVDAHRTAAAPIRPMKAGFILRFSGSVEHQVLHLDSSSMALGVPRTLSSYYEPSLIGRQRPYERAAPLLEPLRQRSSGSGHVIPR